MASLVSATLPSQPLPSPALKVVLVCFERSLGNQWYRLSLQVKEMALRKVGGLAFWDFIDFIVRTRIPIFVLLRPFIQCKVKDPCHRFMTLLLIN